MAEIPGISPIKDELISEVAPDRGGHSRELDFGSIGEEAPHPLVKFPSNSSNMYLGRPTRANEGVPGQP